MNGRAPVICSTTGQPLHPVTVHVYAQYVCTPGYPPVGVPYHQDGSAAALVTVETALAPQAGKGPEPFNMLHAAFGLE
jgi:hypothetical protein